MYAQSLESKLSMAHISVVLFVNDLFKRTNLLGEQTKLNNFLKQIVNFSVPFDLSVRCERTCRETLSYYSHSIDTIVCQAAQCVSQKGKNTLYI